MRLEEMHCLVKDEEPLPVFLGMDIVRAYLRVFTNQTVVLGIEKSFP